MLVPTDPGSRVDAPILQPPAERCPAATASPRLKYILIVADAMLVGRVFLAEKVGVLDALGMTTLPLTSQEITAMAPIYFALVAFSGGARFSV